MKNTVRIVISLILILCLTLSLAACDIPNTDGTQGGAGQGGSTDSGTQGGSTDSGTQGGADGSGTKPAETEGLEYTYIKDTDSYKVTGYQGTATEVIIPAQHEGKAVTVIGEAFYRNAYITKVTLPDSVTEIINSAFAFCSSLSEIEFGTGLKTLTNGAFSTCTSLKSITLPDSITTVQTMAFYDCTALEEVTFGSGTTWIARYVFVNCPALTRVTLPEGNWYHSSSRTKWMKCIEGELLAFGTPEQNAVLLKEDYIRLYIYKA